MSYVKIDRPVGVKITEEIFNLQKQNRAEWVQRLRSGKYAQTGHSLRRGDAYCCLGVMCDIVNPDGWLGDNTKSSGLYDFEESGGIVPEIHRSFEFGLKTRKANFVVTAGLLTKFPRILERASALQGHSAASAIGRWIGLTDLNDDGFSFAEIADIIEYGPDSLFFQPGDTVAEHFSISKKP